jgi:hypothetical protein
MTAEQIYKENKEYQPLSLKTDKELDDIYRKGDAIILENQACQGEYLYADDLK